MDENTLSKICFFIILLGLIAFVIFYEEEFKERDIEEMLLEIGTKGKLFGRVDQVISNSPYTIFIFTQNQSVKVFYPKETNIEKNDFVLIYATSNEYKSNKELFAHKVIVE